MLAFAFQTLPLQRVWAQCLAENTASVRVLERLGMRQERCQRPQQTWMQPRRWDQVVYTINRAEWQELMETKR
jgi:RimJ/RimL family protein N-acetyltransferase